MGVWALPPHRQHGTVVSYSMASFLVGFQCFPLALTDDHQPVTAIMATLQQLRDGSKQIHLTDACIPFSFRFVHDESQRGNIEVLHYARTDAEDQPHFSRV